VPFTSVGEKARWKVLYAKLRAMAVGETLTYEIMGELLDLDPRADRQSIRISLRRAAEELLEKDSRALDAVRGVGYEIVQPRDQLRLARRHGVKAGNQMVMASRMASFVNMEGMAPDVRQGFEVMALGFSQQRDINARQDRKNRDMVAALEQASTKQERTEEEVTELQQRLADLEAKLNPTD
jgi:hypothetical protein